MSPIAITTLINICSSHPSMSPNKGMTVHEAANCKSQKRIHLDEFSRLHMVPTNGRAKQARNTNGDRSMMRNIKIFYNLSCLDWNI